MGAWTLQKWPLEGGSEKAWQFNEKSTRKSMVFDGSEPRLALYSSLISHFRHFWKNSKKRCQKGGQKSCFLIPKPTFGAQGSIESAILAVFRGFEKSLIFRRLFWVPKNRKKCSEDRPGSSLLWKRGSLLLARGPQGAAFSRAVSYFPRILFSKNLRRRFCVM